MDFLKIGGSWWITFFVATGVFIFLLVFIQYREKISKFFGEVKVELSKCTWPWNPEQTGIRKYRELIDSTVIVSVVALLLAAYVSTFDFLIMHLVGFVVRF